MTLLDRMYQPHYGGGWLLARWLYFVVAVYMHLQRISGIGDVYGAPDMTFRMGPFYLADYWILTPTSAWIVWGVGLVALLLVPKGGQLAKVGIVVWLLSTWCFLANEALNIKAYDRLMTWISFGLLLSPFHRRDLLTKPVSPFARWFLLIVFCAIYGSTGWLKLTKDFTHWINGDVLSYHLVHMHFGSTSLGIWLSTVKPVLIVASWVTLIFEAAFPFLIWWRRANPILLVMGFSMHMGILTLMNVGPFSYVAVVVYPVLLTPDLTKNLFVWLRGRLGMSASTDVESATLSDPEGA